MSPVRIDVTWRGLEVGRGVPLHSMTEAAGRLDVPLPMPVGSALALRSTDGQEIPAVVTRVFEQSTGGGEPPGMLVAPILGEASRAWWSARAEESAAAALEPPPSASPDAPDDDEPAMIVAPVDPATRPTMVFTAVDLSATPAGAPASPAAGSARASRAPAAPATMHASEPTAPTIEVVNVGPTTLPEFAPVGQPHAEAAALQGSAVPAPSEHRVQRSAAVPVQPQPAAQAPRSRTPSPSPVAAFGPVATPPADDDASGTKLMFGAAAPEVSDDASRTTVMPAVDLEAIMADGAAHAATGDDGTVEAAVNGESSGEASGEVSSDGTRGKPKVGPRGKRRRGR